MFLRTERLVPVGDETFRIRDRNVSFPTGTRRSVWKNISRHMFPQELDGSASPRSNLEDRVDVVSWVDKFHEMNPDLELCKDGVTLQGFKSKRTKVLEAKLEQDAKELKATLDQAQALLLLQAPRVLCSEEFEQDSHCLPEFIQRLGHCYLNTVRFSYGVKVQLHQVFRQ